MEDLKRELSARARRHIEAEKRSLGTTSEAKVIHAAIRNAVQDCKAKGYLMDYWEKMTEEDMSVFEDEWDQDIALEVRWEEGIEEGMAEKERQLLALIDQGYTIEDLKRELSGARNIFCVKRKIHNGTLSP